VESPSEAADVTLHRFPLLAVLFGLLLTGTLSAGELPSAKPEAVGLSPAGLQKAHDAVSRLIKDGQVAGAITLVSRHGKVAFFEAQGVRDVATAKPMEKDTIGRFYSMTKPVTTVAAMILWEEGRFQLDDPVSQYLPEFKGLKVYAGGKGDDLKLVNPKREMSVRDLMRHTSGLTYGFITDTPIDQLYRKHRILNGGIKLEAMVSKLAKIPLLYEPGTHFQYSMSTDVLGRLVEVLSKKRLDDFFRQRIFTPLDMKDTGFYVLPDERTRLAATHGKNSKGKLVVTESPLLSPYLLKPVFLSGGGGLVSTARDYARFCQMLLNRGELDGRRILKEKTVREMTTNQLPAEAMPLSLGVQREGVGFGLGFAVRVGRDRNEPLSPVGEYGWGGAASTHFWISPKDDLFVIVLQQYQPFNPILEATLKPIIYQAIKDRPK
jgi:CubicO group peptidase (beta-lactamase class C family)